MRTGIFPATEGAIAACVWALALGLVWYRTLSWRRLVKVSMDTIETTSAVLLIVAAASIFGWMLTATRTTEMLASWVLSVVSTPAGFLLLANLLMLFVGCFLEPTAAITILVPILLPIVHKLGIDPVHFGLVMVLNLTHAGPPGLQETVARLLSTARQILSTYRRGFKPFKSAVRQNAPDLLDSRAGATPDSPERRPRPSGQAAGTDQRTVRTGVEGVTVSAAAWSWLSWAATPGAMPSIRTAGSSKENRCRTGRMCITIIPRRDLSESRFCVWLGVCRGWAHLPSRYQAFVGYARDGYPVTARLAGWIAACAPELAPHAASAALFLPGGEPARSGTLLRNRGLARTLEAVASEGAAGFYAGEVGATLAGFVATEGGFFTENDLKAQDARWSEPLVGSSDVLIRVSLGL
jgi:hypothetical protein